MIIDLSPEAQEYGRLSRSAFEAAGGDQLVERAEADPAGRGDLVAPVLGELGAWDLDPHGSADDLEAAAALCRSAGYWAVPHPIAERLARPSDLDVNGLVVVHPVAPAGRVDHLDLRWAAVSLDGHRSRATPGPSNDTPRTSAFVTGLDLDPADGDATTAEVALALTLPCWTLLGMLDRAMDLTRTYVVDRHQFGQTLSSFQGVQFQLTDAEVERVGVEQLALYALWSIQTHRPEAIDDALALRTAALDAADVVFRITHQLHGAIGFCDEAVLSWLSRHSQPLRRLPFGPAATRHHLATRIARTGLTGLFTVDTP